MHKPPYSLYLSLWWRGTLTDIAWFATAGLIAGLLLRTAPVGLALGSGVFAFFLGLLRLEAPDPEWFQVDV